MIVGLSHFSPCLLSSPPPQSRGFFFIESPQSQKYLASKLVLSNVEGFIWGPIKKQTLTTDPWPLIPIFPFFFL